MAKNVDTKVLDKAVQAKLGGLASKEVLKQFNLSHSQFEFHYLYTVELAKGGMLEVARSVPCTGEAVVAARHEGHASLKGTTHEGPLSWGKIAVLCGASEAKVRSTYTKHTNTLSEGQRIGKGGRFYELDERYYENTLRKPGTVIPAAAKKDKQAKLDAAAVQALQHAYRLAGGTAKNPTPAQMKQAIAKAEKPAKK